MPVEINSLTKVFLGTAFGSWLFVGAAKVAPRLVLPPGAARSEESREFARSLAESMFPLDLRRDGILNDAEQFRNLRDLPLAKIAAPALIIHGDDDVVVSHQQSVDAARAISGAEFISIEGGTHVTTPVDERTRSALNRFLADGGRARNEG